MKLTILPSVLALALSTWTGVEPADAQTPVCPPGYYYASDGLCYPGPPPVYAPPPYVVAPPVYAPPPVFDGFAIGLGLGALIGGHEEHGGERGGFHHGGHR